MRRRSITALGSMLVAASCVAMSAGCADRRQQPFSSATAAVMPSTLSNATGAWQVLDSDRSGSSHGLQLTAFAGSGFDIVGPGRPGVPIIINNIDASYSVVEGVWGLGKNVQVQPTIYGGR